MRSLVIGLGSSGAGLHLPVLRRLRDTVGRGLFADARIVGCDPAGPGTDYGTTEPAWTASVRQAARLLDPDDTVVHVCTPPTTRVQVLTELAEHGFRQIIVEKPLATREADLDEILGLRRRLGLRLAVVAPWLASELTRRLVNLVHDGQLGRLRSVSVVQSKPRFRRSLATTGHPTAFDIELPHALGVALRLAGPAEVTSASCADLVVDDRRMPRLGGAGVRLRHASGVRTHLMSDLAAPVRERRITLRFEHGTATGNYAVGGEDDHAQLMVAAGGRHEHSVFPDDAFGACLLGAYRAFAGKGEVWPADFALAVEVVRLLAAAKARPEIGAEVVREPVATAGLVASHAD